MHENINGAIFDMDGTLVDSLFLWDVIWESFGRRFLHKEGFRPTPEDDKAARTLTLKDALVLMHENYGLAESASELLAACWRV